MIVVSRSVAHDATVPTRNGMDADASVDHCVLGGGQLAGDAAGDVGSDAGSFFDGLGREGGDRGECLVETVQMRCRRTRVDKTLGGDDVGECTQEQGIGARPDGDMLVWPPLRCVCAGDQRQRCDRRAS